MTHDQAHHSHPAPAGTEASRLSSDEGENEEREEATEKLDCHYSGYHPRPAAVSTRILVIISFAWTVKGRYKYFFLLFSLQHCTFGSRLYGRGCYAFDRRWDQVRSALTSMLDKHVNSQMWK